MLPILSKPVALAFSVGALAAVAPAFPTNSAWAQLLAVRPSESFAAFYEAHLTGAITATLRGGVEFGEGPTGAPFVTTLGAYSDNGAIIVTRRSGQRPEPGTYPITAEPTQEGLVVLVVTGSPTHPTGVFRAEHGSVTITSSSPRLLSGQFEVQARGFLAAAPENEDREITARGSFAARAVRQI